MVDLAKRIGSSSALVRVPDIFIELVCRNDVCKRVTLNAVWLRLLSKLDQRVGDVRMSRMADATVHLSCGQR